MPLLRPLAIIYHSCAVKKQGYIGKMKLLKEIEPVHLQVCFPVPSAFQSHPM